DRKVNPYQLKHISGKQTENFDEVDILRAAKTLDLKARATDSSVEKLKQTPLPAIVQDVNGTYFILARFSDEKALVHYAGDPVPKAMSPDEFEKLWNKRLILITTRKTIQNMFRKFDISWFIPAIIKYKKLFGEVLISSFFLQLFALVSPLLFQVIIDKVLVHHSLSTLDVIFFCLIAIALFECVLGALRTYVFSHTTNRVDVELGAQLFKHLLGLPMSYFGARRVGDTVARVRELENIRNFITGSALTLVIDTAFTFVFFAVMFFYSPLLTWIVLASLPFYIGLSLFASPILHKRVEEKFKHGAENQSFLVETVSAVETVKSLAVEPQSNRTWEQQLAAYVASSFKVSNLANICQNAIKFIQKITMALTLFFGATLVIKNELTVGQLVAFNMLSGHVAAPILRLAQLWQDFQQVRISIERLGDVLNTPTEPAVNSGQAPNIKMRGEIKFDHVNFRYLPDKPLVLESTNLFVKPGESIGIVGSSGSGKSTLTKLVQRLYIPESGRITIDDIDIATADPAWLRRQIGVVLQENTLFNRSIRDNIALADPTVPIERVMAVAKTAGAHEFIAGMPEGYDTIVGERGASLSGGQRQRIAIARALLTNPRILILDEATSALDYESESLIKANMKKISTGRTVLTIAHRLSTVRTCDRIIVIEKGKIIEQGTHDDLIKLQGSRYGYLWDCQINDKLEGA
ncbi:MAG: type I secretion system permease/ATPase, partial [Lactobacillales bacterium]|nr:type I secretion system permease/ATPase [Lactobacillales bacterium]